MNGAHVPSASTIAAARMALGIRQSDLAAAAGLSAGRVGDYEQRPERVGNMTLLVAGRLARALHVTLDEFEARFVRPDMRGWTAVEDGYELTEAPLGTLVGDTAGMSLATVHARLLDRAVKRRLWMTIVLDAEGSQVMRITERDVERETERRNKEKNKDKDKKEEGTE